MKKPLLSLLLTKNKLNKGDYADEETQKAIEDWQAFEVNKKKHEAETQKKYQYQANLIWNNLPDDEWLDLDTIKRALYEPEKLDAYEWTLEQWREVVM